MAGEVPSTEAVPTVGIGSEESTENADTADSSIADIEESAVFSAVNPLDAYFGAGALTEEDLAKARLDDAVRVAVINECMIEGGFGWYIEEPAVTAPVLEESPVSEDLRAVRERGYRAYIFDSWIEDAARDVERGRIVAQLSETELEAWADWYDQCADRSYTVLAQQNRSSSSIDVPPALRLALSEERAWALERIRANPGFDQIWADWSDCMAQSGYTVTDRADAVALIDEEYLPIAAGFQQHPRGEPLPSELQRRADELARREAVIVAADIGCADQTDLDRRITELRHQLRTAEVEQNGARWELLRLELCSYLPAGQSPCT